MGKSVKNTNNATICPFRNNNKKGKTLTFSKQNAKNEKIVKNVKAKTSSFLE